MKEIKFRAWHKKKKQMRVVLGLEIMNQNVWVSDYLDTEIDDGHTTTWKYEDIEIMQYIGLEGFYEGDIHNLKLNGIETHIEYVDAIIEFNMSYFAFSYRVVSSHSGYNVLTLVDKNILGRKPLGNEYENPELLK